jgi:hypothetical protein
LATVTVYTPVCPWGKLPLWVEDTVSDGAGVMMVESVAVALADPPPEALTEFTCGEDALEATLTVTVIGG